MKTELKMPRFRDDADTAILCAWLKEPGEAFSKGDVLCEIETEKVVNQVEAQADGVMGNQLAEEGDEVAIGDVIAEVEG